MKKEMKMSNLFFRVLLSLTSLGFLLILLGGSFSRQGLPLLGLVLIIFSSLPLFVFSVYQLSKKREKSLALLGLALSILSLTLAIGSIVALRQLG